MMCILTIAFLRGTTPGSPRRGLAITTNVLFAQRLQTGPMTLRQSGSVLDLVIEHAFGTILSCRPRLSRTSRAPSRLIRPRPIYCNRAPEQMVKTFPVFGQFFFEHCQKKCFQKIPHLVLIYTPKEAHSRSFVTAEGQYSRCRVQNYYRLV